MNLTRNRQRFCDGISRRQMLQIGAAGLAGLNLPDILGAEARTGRGSSEKSVIHIFLQGGPSHLDMVDLKPEAPANIRGPFKSIPTAIPGIHFCEYMPKLAKLAKKMAVIRSVTGFAPRHRLFPIASGYPREGRNSLTELGGRPTQSAVVQKLMNPIDPLIPTSILLNRGAGNHAEGSPIGMQDPGFLGPPYRAFMATPFLAGKQSTLSLRQGVTVDRFHRRQRLGGSLDTLRREIDSGNRIEAADRATQLASNILLSSKLREALDLKKESPALLERYGAHKRWDMTFEFVPSSFKHNYGRYNEDLVLARRLIEAGSRFVMTTWGHWDTHGNNFPIMKNMLPAFDTGLSGLITDLYERGLDKTTLVIVWGEFGRSPKVGFDGNSGGKPGRNHWPAVGMAMIIGGGMQMGQVIGKTDAHAAAIKERPVHIQEVMATAYHHLGLDPKTTTITDPAGRPQYLVDHNDPIRELI